MSISDEIASHERNHELALRLSKIVRAECSNVPHDIGIRLVHAIHSMPKKQRTLADELIKHGFQRKVK